MEEEVAESKNLEYKESLDLNQTEHKRKLLKTASAFANTNGGLLILGIEAKDGIPTDLSGVKIDNEDKTGIQIEDTIRNNSEPRIPSIEIEFIEKSGTDNYYILVKIQRSWNSPHRVKLGGTVGKFYLRRDRKNDEMDIFELKTAFNLSETLADKIRNYREDRIYKITSEDSPVQLLNNSKIVIHLVPLNAFYPGQSHAIGEIARNWPNLRPFGDVPDHGRYNLDGFLTYYTFEDEKNLSYLQVYRNGIIESTDSHIIFEDYIPSHSFEERIIYSINSYLDIQKHLNVETPILLFLTFIGVKGKYMDFDRPFGMRRNDPVIDRDILLLPEFIIEEYDKDIPKIIRLCIDSVWNACGYPKSPNFNEDDEWQPRD